MVYYFDTSALVKRYAQETGTAWVMSITDPAASHDVYVARIAGPEMIAALFRKVRMGEISQTDAIRAATNFRTDFHTQYQIVELTADDAGELAWAAAGGFHLTSLPALLGRVMAILQAYPLCKHAAIVETKEFAADQFFFKVRTELPGEFKLQGRA